MRIPYTRIYRAVLFTGAAVSLFSGLLTAGAGQLDPTFGRDGKVLTPFPAGGFAGASANAVALQSDGKIVVAGLVTDSAGNPNSILVRYNPNGALDTSFGTAGMAELTSPDAGQGFFAVANQSDGKIVAATAQIEAGLIVARFNTNGTLDPSFGTGGLVITPFQGNTLIFAPLSGSLLIQPDGDIIVGCVGLTRLDTDGSLDGTFGSNGQAAIAGGPITALQSNGEILTVGSVFGNLVSRYTSTGALDTTFGMAGIAGAPAILDAVAIQSNGSIVTGGSFTTQPAPTGSQLTELVLIRYTSSGVPDVTFGSGGAGFAPPVPRNESNAAGIAIQTNGSIVAVGQTGVAACCGSSSGNQFLVTRFTSAGQLDNTFGTDGQVITSFGGSPESATGVVIQSDGKIVVVGNSAKLSSPSEGTDRFALARYLAQ